MAKQRDMHLNLVPLLESWKVLGLCSALLMATLKGGLRGLALEMVIGMDLC